VVAHLQQQVPSSPTDDIATIVEQKIAEEKRRTEQAKIKKLEVDLMVKHDIQPESFTFKRVMEDYRRLLNPSAQAKDAKELLNILIEKHTHSSARSATTEDIQRAQAPRSGATVTDNSVRKVSPEARAIMVKKYGEEKTRRFLSGR
jgi:hypothetical protein